MSLTPPTSAMMPSQQERQEPLCTAVQRGGPLRFFLLPDGGVLAQHVVGGAVVDLDLIDHVPDVVIPNHLGDGIAGVAGIHLEGYYSTPFYVIQHSPIFFPSIRCVTTKMQVYLNYSLMGANVFCNKIRFGPLGRKKEEEGMEQIWAAASCQSFCVHRAFPAHSDYKKAGML